MADAVGGAATKAAWKVYGPSPGINIIRFLQGIVEIAIRVACIVLAFGEFVSACAAAADLDIDTGDNRLGKYQSAAGWLIFITIMIFIYEGLIITARFLNFGLINNFIVIFLIIDIVISIVFACSLFAGAIAAAVYVDDARTARSSLEHTFGAMAAFGFFTMFAFIGLAVWMVLFIVFGWNEKLKQSAADHVTGAV